MRLGFNFTTNDTLEIVQRMIREREIEYCEVLIDNFLHVQPSELIDAIDCPVGFHIMQSRFIENDDATLADIARRIRVFIDAMKPIYVSDHILRYYHNGRSFHFLGEVDYSNYDNIRPRIERWQDLLGVRIHLENYPSIMDGGWDAPAFFSRLERETGAGVLFDASNAIVAQHNCGAPVDLWTEIVASTRHFHVSSYGPSFIEPHVIADTHDRELAADTLEFLRIERARFDKSGATMTYERDWNFDYGSICDDLRRLRAVFAHAEEETHDSPAACFG